jgi:hypothetical protein
MRDRPEAAVFGRAFWPIGDRCFVNAAPATKRSAVRQSQLFGCYVLLASGLEVRVRRNHRTVSIRANAAMGESVSPLGRDILSCFVNRRMGGAGIYANLAGATSLELCENRRLA